MTYLVKLEIPLIQPALASLLVWTHVVLTTAEIQGSVGRDQTARPLSKRWGILILASDAMALRKWFQGAKASSSSTHLLLARPLGVRRALPDTGNAIFTIAATKCRVADRLGQPLCHYSLGPSSTDGLLPATAKEKASMHALYNAPPASPHHLVRLLCACGPNCTL